MFGIIGSGFGLYGHLPVIAKLDIEPICLPARYRDAFEKRNELKVFADRLLWLPDENSVLEQAQSVVFSVWPKGQEYWAIECLRRPNLRAIYLEKPLASSPDTSEQLLKRLMASGKQFRINYSFLFTNWYKEIKNIFKKNEVVSLQIDWSFLAHHYKHQLDNWKRYNSFGGGALRFYGIHLLAVLGDLKINRVVKSTTFGSSQDDMSKWKIDFGSPEDALCRICVDCNAAQSGFKIKLKYKGSSGILSEFTLDMKDPFSDVVDLKGGLDPRTEILSRMYAYTNKSSDVEMYMLYTNINTIWMDVEAKNFHSCVT